jgi:hypothetical protein
MNDENEKRIVSALENYKPKPGPRFYQRMDSSPWNQEKRATHQFAPRRFAVGIAAILIAVIALSMSIPSVRAAVLKYLGLNVSASETVPNPAISAESLVDSRKVDEISSLAGWKIKTPTWLPEGYQFLDAQYDATNQMVLLTFDATRQLPGGDPSMTETKVITMVQALHNDILPLTVAPTTKVLDVTINGQPGAYATGAWESDAVTGTATWNSSYDLKNVYWQMDTLYLSLNTADDLVSQEDLLRLAESTK